MIKALKIILFSLIYLNAFAQGFNNPNRVTGNFIITAGTIDLGDFTSDPSGFANGQMYYNTTSNKFKCRENGATVNCIGSGGGLTGSGTTGTIPLWSSSSALTDSAITQSSGNVGINTSTYGAKLEVKGSGTGKVLIGENAGNSAYGAITLGGTNNDTSYNFTSSAGDTNLYINRPAGKSIQFQEGANTNPTLFINTGGAVSVGSNTTTSQFNVGTSNQCQINGSGNIVKLNNVVTSTPSTQGLVNTFMRNDGSGNWTWVQDPSAILPQSGLLFDYKFTKCDGTINTGSVIPDCSGNGNTATMTGTAGWTTTGILLNGTTNYATLDTSITSSIRTLIFYGDRTTLTTSSANRAFFGGTGGGQFYLIMNNAMFAQPSVYPNAGQNEAFEGRGPGFYGLTMSGTDKAYISTSDSSFIHELVLSSNSFSRLSGQTLNIGGASLGGGSWFYPGNVYRAVAYSTALTSEQMQQAYWAILSDAQHRGIAIAPRNESITNQVLFIGDSITLGNNSGSTPYPDLVSTTDTLTHINYGLGGVTVGRLSTLAPGQFFPHVSPAAHNVAVVMAGTNDIAGGTTPAVTLAGLASLCRSLKQHGFQVLVVGNISRNGFDTNIAAYNVLIKNSWKQYADWYVLPNALLTATNAYSNTTYFNVDGVHPKTAGNTLLAADVSGAINIMALGGSNLLNPGTHTISECDTSVEVGTMVMHDDGSNHITLCICVQTAAATYSFAPIPLIGGVCPT